MSKAAKQSILILLILLLSAFAFASITFLQKQQLEQVKGSLEKQLADFQKREKQQLLDNQQMQEKLKGVETAKEELEKRLSTVGVDINSIDGAMKKLTEERDQWKKRVDELQAERDKVVAKLEEKEKEGPKVVYKYVEGKAPEGQPVEGAAPTANPEAQKTAATTTPAPASPTPVTDDAYWAQVLKERAALELELEKVKNTLTNNSVEVADLKKKNSDLQLELNQLSSDKETIQREIKNANDLADSLALELARAKNDRKFLGDRVTKLSDDNGTLRDQIKKLTSTKIALEKTIIRIQDEKKDVEKKLQETENVIQSRIDEIWKIKESLSQNVNPAKPAASQEVELTPIVVSSDQQTPAEAAKQPQKPTGFNGSVVSVNEENNFVIVDIGENSGIKLGETLNVYRGSEYIAGLQVIQTRKDILAADIKSQVAKIKVGDNVK